MSELGRDRIYRHTLAAKKLAQQWRSVRRCSRPLKPPAGNAVSRRADPALALGELLGWRWVDVNGDKAEISVTQQREALTTLDDLFDEPTVLELPPKKDTVPGAAKPAKRRSK